MNQCRHQRPRHHTAGFTLLELLVAVLIATSALALIVPTFIRQLGVSTEADSLTTVESVVSRDLGWISNYARTWRSTTTNMPELVYQPPADRCSAGTIADAFLEDLATVTTNPARPYLIDPISTAATTLTIINGIEIRRAIQPRGSTLQIRYSLSGEKSSSLRFLRQASVLIEAAAWCERLP